MGAAKDTINLCKMACMQSISPNLKVCTLRKSETANNVWAVMINYGVCTLCNISFLYCMQNKLFC